MTAYDENRGQRGGREKRSEIERALRPDRCRSKHVLFQGWALNVFLSQLAAVKASDAVDDHTVASVPSLPQQKRYNLKLQGRQRQELR